MIYLLVDLLVVPARLYGWRISLKIKDPRRHNTKILAETTGKAVRISMLMNTTTTKKSQIEEPLSILINN